MTECKNNPPHVYTAIAEIAGELAKDGVGKDGKNTQQGYAFRGIDQIYNALAPKLSKHGLVILTRVLDRQVTEKKSVKVYNGESRETTLFYVALKVDFDFVSSKDGTKHTVTTYGEAMDSGDKATNKAMSTAYKYAVIQGFCIPTEGDNDADSTTHEVSEKPSKADRRLISEINQLASPTEAKSWWKRNEQDILALPEPQQEMVEEQWQNKVKSIEDGTAINGGFKWESVDASRDWAKNDLGPKLAACQTPIAVNTLVTSNKMKIDAMMGQAQGVKDRDRLYSQIEEKRASFSTLGAG